MKKVYKTNQDVIRAIDSVLSLLSARKDTKSFFAKSVRDLSALRERFANNETRIAIIGITSSGKSTLMNAVLGEALLPTRVGPSSSRQVLCGWDERQEAEIIFDADTGKAKRTLTGSADAIRKTLEQYGDEKFNPGNRENVDEIRVHAPGFRFNRDLVIIDTPGLDAYGLDQHKEVTMKLVLPTVDMIMFLTNVKCDSDGRNLEFIDKATTDNKPLIVVQNKIDSIEAKLSKNGVEKTVEEIKGEHRRRLERLIANAQKESVRKAPIVQVSAKSDWKHSNLPELGKILDEQVRINSDFRAGRRFHQFTDIITQMRNALCAKLEESERSESTYSKENQKLSAWQGNVDDLSEFIEQTDAEIKRRMTAVSDCCESLLHKISGRQVERQARKGLAGIFSGLVSELGNTSRGSLSDDAKRTKRDFEKLTSELNEYFSAAITETQSKVRTCCKDLNIDERQTVQSKPFRSQYVSISDGQKTRRVKEEYQVEQRGFFGGAKRFFGSIFRQDDWGYETRYRWVTETYVDVKALLKEINQSYTSFMRVISEQADTYVKNYSAARDVLARELDDRRESVRSQRGQTLPTDVAKNILMELEAESASEFAGAELSIRNAVVPKTAYMSGGVSAMQEHMCTPEVLAVWRLAHALSFEAAYALADGVVRRAGMSDVVVCGWDADKLQSFREWFFRPSAGVQVVDFTNATVMPNADAVVFLLVNAEQVGSFRGKLLGGGLPAKFVQAAAKRGKIVWVMDSIREHVGLAASGDSLIDAFSEMIKLVRDALKGGSAFDIMVCDRYLYWSVLLHELYFDTEIIGSETRRQRFVEQMSAVFGLTDLQRHATGSYVSQYASIMRNK